MKNILTVSFLFFILIVSNAQEVSLKPKFFTLRNARISTGLGFERGLNRYISNTNSLLSNIDSSEYNVYNFSVDLYAPNSFLGFMMEANYGNWDLNMRNRQNKETFLVRTIEFPFYLKFRFGRIEKNSRMWLLAGASYIKPVAVFREFNNENVDRDLSQINGVKVLTGMVGYEQYFGERKNFKAQNPNGTYDRMRFVLFLRYSYVLDSRLNSSYYQSSVTNSILKDYPDFSLNNYSVSLGIKYFFRIGIF